jgi:hypothetical protein
LSPSKNATAKFISELVDGGWVGWERLRKDSNGYPQVYFRVFSVFLTHVNFVDVSPSVNWQNLFNSLNSIAVLEFQGKN